VALGWVGAVLVQAVANDVEHREAEGEDDSDRRAGHQGDHEGTDMNSSRAACVMRQHLVPAGLKPRRTPELHHLVIVRGAKPRVAATSSGVRTDVLVFRMS